MLIIISMKLSYPRFYKLQKAMDKVNSVVQEYLPGRALGKAFGTYDKETEKFKGANSDLMNKGISSQIIITMISPLMTLTVGIGTVLVIYFGSKMFARNAAQPGDITAFTIYMDANPHLVGYDHKYIQHVCAHKSFNLANHGSIRMRR